MSQVLDALTLKDTSTGKTTEYQIQDKVARAQIAAQVKASTDSDADYAAEVVDARVGADGESYDSLGEAVRGQREKSKEEIELLNKGLGENIHCAYPDWSRLRQSAGTTTFGWYMNYVYPSGYVKNIIFKATKENISGVLYIVKYFNDSFEILDTINVVTTIGENVIEYNKLVLDNYIIVENIDGMSYEGRPDASYKSGASDIISDITINPPFQYMFAIRVEYYDAFSSINKILKLYTDSESKFGSAIKVSKIPVSDYTSINEAILNNPDKIVEVDYGTYDEQIENRNTNKKIIGKNRNACIVYDESGNYETPPIEISGGILENLTFFEDNTINPTGKLAYAMHCDSKNCENNTLICRNCNFEVKGNAHGVGFGIYANEKVFFENCSFTSKGGGNSLYLHNTESTGNEKAKITFKDCIFESDEKDFKLQDWNGETTSSIEFEFINCTFTNGGFIEYRNYGETETTTIFKNKFSLSKKSHGNNVEYLNYQAK